MLTAYFHGVRKVFHAVKMCFHGLKIDFQGLKNLINDMCVARHLYVYKLLFIHV